VNRSIFSETLFVARCSAMNTSLVLLVLTLCESASLLLPRPSLARERRASRLALQPFEGRARRPRMCDIASQLERLERLQRALEAAVKGENFSEAASLRDELARLKMDSELAVLSVNAAFYTAFSTGDRTAMGSLWLPGDGVVCAHPGHEAIVGIEAVLESWEEVFATKGDLVVTASSLRCHFPADSVAMVSCIETVQPGNGRLAATNLFERDPDGRWLMCLHQAGPIML